MKQFLDLPLSENIDNSRLANVLATNFPEYNVTCGKDVRVKKNILVSVRLKAVRDNGRGTVRIQYGTITPWWTWLVVGWLIYYAVRVGFLKQVEEVLRDEFGYYPDKSCTERWRKATLWTSVAAALMLLYQLFFNSSLYYMLVNIFCEPEKQMTFINIGRYSSYIINVCFIAIGILFWWAYPCAGTRKGGFLLVCFSLVTPVANILFPVFGIVGTQSVVCGVLAVVIAAFILCAAGRCLDKAIATGPSRYMYRVLVCEAVISVVSALAFQFLWLNAADALISARQSTILAFVFWPFTTLIFIKFLYTMVKMRRYQPQRTN